MTRPMTMASARQARAKRVIRTAPAPGTRDAAGRAPEDHRFPVVGIGASAGGLDAFKKLLAAAPGDSGMAFVLIPHLDPTHESLMVGLLATQTTMPVIEASDGLTVEPSHVYVIPPNADLAIEK